MSNEHTLREIYRKKIPDDVKRTYRTYISFRRYFFQLYEGGKRSKNRERTIGENEAWGIITNGCPEIRKRASFFISPRCEFRILNVKAINLEESSSRVEIDTFSQGHMYSITFKAVYNIY